MDLAAGTRASLRAGSRCVTVAVDAMVFHAPVFVGDEVTCYTEITKVGRTSLSLHVEAWVRRGRHNEPPVKVTSGLFHFVAVDDAGRPTPLPPAENAATLKAADGLKESDG
jgi:acyl-CoA thioesterase YciA